jgi:hypothetical protein
MAITSLMNVKICADLYTRAETSGSPTTASVGILGDIWLNIKPADANIGKTYELTSITGTSPNFTYVWTAVTLDDAKINLMIPRAESDYLKIRGVPFDLSEVDGTTIIYPDSASLTAAEMVCYLCHYALYQGRGEKSESLGDKSESHDEKICGYPVSIVGTIDRFQRCS